jgi:purine-binding chemotaxis protein CheW
VAQRNTTEKGGNMTGEARRDEARSGSGEGRAGIGGEFLTFRLGAEEYALDILKVQEIRNFEAATAIANAPAYVRGVVNLRGVIVPIVDLRMLLGLPQAEYTAFTVVIVLNLGDKTVGVVVDAVSDVTELGAEQIRPAPDFAGAMDTRYVLGLGTIDDRMLILADMERLLAGGEAALPALVH